MAKFTVDTQLFRELGELLVGRESTALVELIKNAYDADARAVYVEGRDLEDPEHGRILIEDNGVGMTRAEFEHGFLRIATRTKSQGNKRSLVFDRRYTGEKGIGRLALHKLARHVEIQSFKWNGEPPAHTCLPMLSDGLHAVIDWDAIEGLGTLDDIESSGAVLVDDLRPEPDRRCAGTRILLNNLRRQWRERDISRFHDDVATLVPPAVLVDAIPSGILSEPTLFPQLRVRDSGPDDSADFHIELLGDLAYSESLRASVAASANWILEVNCDAEAGLVRYQIAPTRKTSEKYPIAESLYFEVLLNDFPLTVSFQARILQMSDDVWDKRHRGIRVFMEGFRVLPYGEPADDWLKLNYDFTNRAGRLLPRLGRDFDDIFAGDEKEELVIQGNAAYFGGVFLTHEGAPHLRMLVNREGFLPGPAMEFISERLRLGLDMGVRVRRTATMEVKRARREQAARQKAAIGKSDLRDQPSAWAVGQTLRESSTALADARAAISAGDVVSAQRALERVDEPLLKAQESIREVASEAAMLRVLASIGTELAAFTHEINGLLNMAVGLTRHLQRILEDQNLTRDQRREIRHALEATQDLRQNIERQAVYLVDITSVDARRRRSRQVIADRFDAASRLIGHAAEKRGIEISNGIGTDLRSPPMFPAELTAVFTNLLTNAVKFSNKGGRIVATGRAGSDGGGVHIRVENTGVRVRPEGAEKWFEPFRSTTTEVDASLGQGMGLGLTITRSILDEYGARIAFVEPSDGFDAAIEIAFSEK